MCYWALPAVEAALSLRASIPEMDQVEEIRVTSFHQAIRLHTSRPQSTEEAQYSLPWAVACALHRGTVDQQSVTNDLDHPKVLRLSGKVQLCESVEFSACFPAHRYATVAIRLNDGRELVSDRFEARGTPGNPIAQSELVTKFYELAGPALGPEAHCLERAVHELSDQPVTELLAQLTQPPPHQHPQESSLSHATAT